MKPHDLLAAVLGALLILAGWHLWQRYSPGSRTRQAFELVSRHPERFHRTRITVQLPNGGTATIFGITPTNAAAVQFIPQGNRTLVRTVQ
jgi:hypothetical protein